MFWNMFHMFSEGPQEHWAPVAHVSNLLDKAFSILSSPSNLTFLFLAVFPKIAS